MLSVLALPFFWYMKKHSRRPAVSYAMIFVLIFQINFIGETFFSLMRPELKEKWDFAK